MTKKTTPPPWNPYQIFTWTLKQVQAWVDQNGAWAFYDGSAWKLESKRIVPGRYEVRFVEYRP